MPAGSWSVRLADETLVSAPAIVVATGGLSVPQTGSDGGGLRALERLGHVVHPLYPALTPLTASPAVHAGLAGISRTVTIRAAGGRMSETGGFLFTHRGYSGPAVLNVSHLAARRGHTAPPQLLVQWTADGEAECEAALRTGDGLVITRLRAALPGRLAEMLMDEAGIERGQALGSLRRDDRRRLVERLCAYRLPWAGDEGYRKAEVTGGGVALDEVDPRTLESRRCPGLFLCGELLDAFGPIGGHNFAWAWATGRLAGLGAAARVHHSP